MANVVNIRKGFSGDKAGGSGRGVRANYTSEKRFTLLLDGHVEADELVFPLTDGQNTIPAAGTTHPTHADRVSLIPQVENKGGGYYHVLVKYETIRYSAAEEETDDPLSVPTDYAWGWKSRQVPYDMDLNGNPVWSSEYFADTPVNPPLTRTVYDRTLTITRFQATFNPQTYDPYMGSVCNHLFMNYAAGLPCMGGINGELIRGVVNYYRVTFPITFRISLPEGVPASDAWHRYIMERDVKYIDPSTGLVERTEHGQAVAINSITGEKIPPGGEVYWNWYLEHESMSWAALGLEPS